MRRNRSSKRSKSEWNLCASRNEFYDCESIDGSDSGITEQSKFFVRCQRICTILNQEAALGNPRSPIKCPLSWVPEFCRAAILDCRMTHNVFGRPLAQEGLSSTVFDLCSAVTKACNLIHGTCLGHRETFFGNRRAMLDSSQIFHWVSVVRQCASDSYNSENVRVCVSVYTRRSDCHHPVVSSMKIKNDFYAVWFASQQQVSWSFCSSLCSWRVSGHHMWYVIVIVAMCVMAMNPTMKTLMKVTMSMNQGMISSCNVVRHCMGKQGKRTNCNGTSFNVANCDRKFAPGRFSGLDQKRSGTELADTKPMDNGTKSLTLWWSISVKVDIPFFFEVSSALERGDFESKREGMKSIHLNGCDETIELILRTVISVDGAAADMCGDFAWEVSRNSKGTGKPEALENLDHQKCRQQIKFLRLMQGVLGNLLREYEQRFADLQEHATLTKFCSNVCLAKIFLKGQFFMTLDDDPFDKLMGSCREYFFASKWWIIPGEGMDPWKHEDRSSLGGVVLLPIITSRCRNQDRIPIWWQNLLLGSDREWDQHVTETSEQIHVASVGEKSTGNLVAKARPRQTSNLTLSLLCLFRTMNDSGLT